VTKIGVDDTRLVLLVIISPQLDHWMAPLHIPMVRARTRRPAHEILGNGPVTLGQPLRSAGGYDARGYAHCSTDTQNLSTRRDAPTALGVKLNWTDVPHSTRYRASARITRGRRA
jgi:hypothetical protein